MISPTIMSGGERDHGQRPAGVRVVIVAQEDVLVGQGVRRGGRVRHDRGA